MRIIKLTIEYDGTHFEGWQVQPKGKRTIQGELEKTCQKIFHKKIHVFGAGRTDSGVHALGQVAHFKTDSRLPTEKILLAFNSALPEDISIIEAEDAPKSFHAQYSAKSKLYRYTILNRRARTAISRGLYLHYPYPLNVSLMRKEAKTLVGKKDFKSFQAADAARLREGKQRNAIRTIKKLTVRKSGDFIYIDIEADGFLYKMVRNIVGTLLKIGRKKLPEGTIKAVLAKKKPSFCGTNIKTRRLMFIKSKLLTAEIEMLYLGSIKT